MDAALFEIDNMCHALGFDPNGIRKGQKVYEYYRNFFVASGEHKESWESSLNGEMLLKLLMLS